MKRPLLRESGNLQIQALEPRVLLAGDLRIVELNYHPHPALVDFGERDSGADDFEFIEVMNVGDAQLNLRGYRISEGVDFQFAQQFLNVGERLVVTKNLKDFRSRFGKQIPIALGDDGDGGDGGEYGGSLNNSGETMELQDPAGTVIQRFTFYDTGEWPWLTDGQGSSLEILDPLGDGSDPKNWRASAEYGGSPGIEGMGFPGEVVINELLTHTDLPQLDAVELFNRTEDSIDMTGWFLTDSTKDLFKYKMSGSTAIIYGNDYRTFDQNTLGFALEGQEAESVFLIEANAAGRPLRFVDAVSFSASQNGVSLGRWLNGQGELFPMTDLTFDDANSGPLIGDVVVSEIHYHPPASAVSDRLSQDDLEFVELLNRTGTPLTIGQWRLRKSVDYTFPDETVIGPHGTLLILGFDPFADLDKTREFLDLYGVPDDVPLLGPYSDATDPNADQLDDDGETLILERPEDPLQLGRGYVLVDRVIYGDDNGWPTTADGQGASLTRVDIDGYGDFSSSWAGNTPTPGTTGVRGDLTGDGLVNAEDIDSLCAAKLLGVGNPRYDLNADGRVNQNDLDFLIGTILGTTLGDSNLDGVFNSSDLVAVFAAGQYEDAVPRNSGWASGDWDCDGDFTTSDLVAALATGSYVVSAQPVGTAPMVLIAAANRVGSAAGTTLIDTPSAEADNLVPVVATTTDDRPVELSNTAVDAVFDLPSLRDLGGDGGGHLRLDG